MNNADSEPQCHDDKTRGDHHERKSEIPPNSWARTITERPAISRRVLGPRPCEVRSKHYPGSDARCGDATSCLLVRHPAPHWYKFITPGAAWNTPECP